MAAHLNLNNSFRLNLDNGKPLLNTKPCPEFARTSAFTHAANLIPSRVAGSTAVGAAMIRAPKDRALTLDDFQGRGIYKTISNDYDEEIHRSVDRPFNYRKAFTQTDNIRPTTRQLNMKTLQNLTYQDWARKGIRPKEMYHWTINGIKHTTHKYWNETGASSQYMNDYHRKPSLAVSNEAQKQCSTTDRNLSYVFDDHRLEQSREPKKTEKSTYFTKYTYDWNGPKRGICNPIDGMPGTLVREEDRFRREPTTTKGHYVRQAVEQQRIFSKKDQRPEEENNIRTMRSQMHFETTYRDLFLGKTPVKLPDLVPSS